MIIDLPLFIGTAKNRLHLVPSLNVQKAEHHTAYTKRKNKLALILQTLNLDSIKGAYHVVYKSCRVRLLDPIDNLGASLKCIMDVLQDLNLIEDDSCDFVKSFEPIQIKVKTKAEEHFILEILPIERKGNREFF